MTTIKTTRNKYFALAKGADGLKKLISTALCFIVLLCTLSFTAYASDYTLEIVNGEIDDYGNMTATINISENSKIYSGSFKFIYNSQSFELGDISVNQSGTNGKITYETDEENGAVTFTYKANDEDGCTYGGEFAVINMRLISTSESVLSFNLDMADTKNYDGDKIEATYKISPIKIPQSFIVTETGAAQTATTQKPVTPETAKEVTEQTSKGFFSTLWSVIKVLFIIIVIIVVLMIVASFFTRRYFRNKRRREREERMKRQNSKTSDN